MNEKEILIILKEIDKTKEVEKYSITSNKYLIKFKNEEKEYTYNQEDVIIRNNPENIDISSNDIYYKRQLLLDVEKAIRFDEFIKIFYKEENSEMFNIYNISIKAIKNINPNKNIIAYFKEISKYTKDENSNKESFLQKEYQKLKYIKFESVLDYYINKKEPKATNSIPENIIYPFSFNLSQKEALENIYKSNISIIEGPPGTGKTQTILNIISNLSIMQNKTVAVVSNNNEAVKNVKDKLEKNGYGFITANLGRTEKREEFFKKLPQPKIENFNIQESKEEIFKELKKLNKQIDELLIINNRKAELEKEIEAFKLEQQHFQKYYTQQDFEKIEKLTFYNKTETRILDFLLDTQLLTEDKIKYPIIQKIKIALKYGILHFSKIDKELANYILNLQKEFYQLKIQNLEKEHQKIVRALDKNKFDKLQKKHKQLSKKVFQMQLYERYNKKENKFQITDYKYNIKKFTDNFPVILSTTYSLRNCVPDGFLFDYVIIDEASQVDLLAGSLALSCARNAIIVGDTKQLPQIVEINIKEKLQSPNVEKCYDYFENSILSALLNIFGNKIPRKVLKEHYRCHPKIIEFCNKRFYNNELIPFCNKEHSKVKYPLILHYTAEGNHMRKITRGGTGTYNQRELDVIKEEVLKNPEISIYSNEDIGIITPYREQANRMSKSLEAEIQSDTIHKYQGREKKLMILSTVLDTSYIGKKGIDFVDDPNMVNVAISRAINQFVLVTHNKLFNEEGRDIKALIKYIKYNTLASEIVESQLVSVFDLLYKEYSKKLNSLNSRLKTESKFKSENIMDTILEEAFKQEIFNDYEYIREGVLKNFLKDISNLNNDEKKYVNNGSRIDFVIFDKMNKKPVLFIEVDGFEAHENNPKQQLKDSLKDMISKKNNIKLLRFKTNGTYSKEDILSTIKTHLKTIKASI